MATKYIVNDLTGQTITGNLTINGNIIVTGSSNNSGVYRALLTQTGSISGTTINTFYDGLIIGETYTISTYNTGDDFSNIANIISGGTLMDFDYVWTSSAVPYSGFNGLTGTTSGSGSGASFNAYWCGATNTHVYLLTSGVDYVVGDTITILGTELSGNTPENDMVITVTEVNPNVTGCVFIATGDTPSVWSHSSLLVSDGGLIVDVQENTLGYDLYWQLGLFGGYGTYTAFNNTTGSVYNAFKRDKVEVTTTNTYAFDNGPGLPAFIVPYVSNSFAKDDSIAIDTLYVGGGPGGYSNDLLYYTPVEIKIKQDLDTTPVEIYGEIGPSFPFSYVYTNLYCSGRFIQDFYAANQSTVNNISELITLLNNDINNVYGLVYSEGGPGGIQVTMPTSLKNQFCANGTLTFIIYSDD